MSAPNDESPRSEDQQVEELLLEIRQMLVENVLDGNETGNISMAAAELADAAAGAVVWWLSKDRSYRLNYHYGHHYLRKLLSSNDAEAIRLIAPQVIFQLLTEIDELKDALAASEAT